MIKFLFAGSMLCITTSLAAHTTNIDSVSTESVSDVYANTMKALRPVKLMTPYGGGGSGINTAPCSGTNLGVCSTNITNGTVSASGLGFGYEISLGVAFKGEGKNSGDQHAFSVQIAYGVAKSNVKFNISGKEVNKQYGYGIVSLPVAYTNVKNGHGTVGFYYQGGINFEYNAGVSIGDADVKKDFNSLYFVPFVSAGLAIDHEISYYGFNSETIMIGPFVSYAVNNMSAVNGTTVNCLNYGLRVWAWLGD